MRLKTSKIIEVYGRNSVLLMHSSDGRCYSTMEMAEDLADAGFRDATRLPRAAS